MDCAYLTSNAGRSLVVRSPVFFRAHLFIREMHLELKRRVEESPIWYDSLSDEVLYEQHGDFYRAIGDVLRIDPILLTNTDRHRLFICTEPIEHDGELIPGLSLLEQLMGYEYDFSVSVVGDGPIVLTSGDDDADLIAACHLAFGENAIGFMERFSRKKLLQMLEQVANLTNREERLKEQQQQRDKEMMEKNFGAVEDGFAAMGVSVNF